VKPALEIFTTGASRPTQIAMLWAKKMEDGSG
jgi:hypothetical protein